jgi:hypothetical protein
MDRRQFLASLGLSGLGLAVPSSLKALGDASDVTIGRLNYGAGGWDARDSGIRRLLQELEKRTSVSVDADYPTLSLRQKELFEHPMLAMFGDRGFDPLPAERLKQLRTYLQSGGFLVVDSSEGVRNGPFYQSVKRDLGRIFPDRDLAPIGSDHVAYKSFYLIDDPVGRLSIADSMMGISDGDRLLAVVSQNDIFGALARDNFGNWEYDVRPGGENQREMAFRLGINLVMYALCVNYKADQVHVPFILKRRKWKVD